MKNTTRGGQENNWCVYRHVRLDKNEPFYIGIGKNIERAYQKGSTRRSLWWTRITNTTSYEVDILFENVSMEFAKDKEMEFISLYGRQDINKGTLCNMTNGGESNAGRVHSKETRAKISKGILACNRDYTKAWTNDRKESMSIKITRGKHSCAKKVIDNATGKIYACAKDAADKAGISHGLFYSWLSGVSPNKSTFVYCNQI
jgi:hypothetical protein